MSAQPEPDLPQVDEASFRAAVGRFATGITVVTTRHDGVHHAMTVNSFASVSLDPLLVLFCAEKAARFHAAVLAAGTWGVSVLGESGEAASTWFATRGRPIADQLADHRWRPGPLTGAALLDDAIATLECRTRSVHDGGDHTIVVGDVLAVGRPPGPARPLLYYEGRYTAL